MKHKQNNLHIGICSHKAVAYACKNWHYSKTIPAGKMVRFGVWEDGRYIGCVIYSRGSNQFYHRQFKLGKDQICELTRIALNKHKTPVSKILAITFRLLRKNNPGLKMLLSYSDLDQNHHGGIYQASNWFYIGKVTEGCVARFVIKGKEMHLRSVGAMGWKQSLPWIKQHIDPNAYAIRTQGKHKYVYPLADDMIDACRILRQPFPKRVSSVTVA